MNDLSDSGVRDKLILLEQDFFTSLAEGSPVLQSFLDSWEGFKESLASVELSSHTLGLVYTLAKAIRDISTEFVELYMTSDGFDDELATKITEIFNENMAHPSIGTEMSAPTSYPAYIEPSCKWLLDNLHNPYPSKETRIAISTRTGCPRRYIDNWFIDARKRIGWNILRRNHFSNKRMEIIDAATRFFIKDDPDRPLTIAIEMELATMQAKAQLLHTVKSKGSPSTVVESITACTGKQEQGATSYPSPEPSPGPLLRTSLLPTTGDFGLTAGISAQLNCKRRNSVISLESDSAGLPSKRPRLEVLPSPAQSVDDLEPPSPNKRKRRLSDGGCYGFPKRACHDISVGPRLNTVSDPTCSTSDHHGNSPLDAWFHDFFESVSVEAPDSSTLLDIDVYDCTRFNLEKQSPVVLDSPLHIFSTGNGNNFADSDLFNFGEDFSAILSESVP